MYSPIFTGLLSIRLASSIVQVKSPSPSSCPTIIPTYCGTPLSQIAETSPLLTVKSLALKEAIPLAELLAIGMETAPGLLTFSTTSFSDIMFASLRLFYNKFFWSLQNIFGGIICQRRRRSYIAHHIRSTFLNLIIQGQIISRLEWSVRID